MTTGSGSINGSDTQLACHPWTAYEPAKNVGALLDIAPDLLRWEIEVNLRNSTNGHQRHSNIRIDGDHRYTERLLA
jgi:hypothetical protein